MHKKVKSDEIASFLRDTTQKLKEVGYLRYTFKSYKINMDNPLCIALINEYLKEKKKWPNPFNPGFPKNPDKQGIHIISIDGVLNIFRWLPATKEYMDRNNGLKPYYPTELYNIENCSYYCSFEELPKKWGME